MSAEHNNTAPPGPKAVGSAKDAAVAIDDAVETVGEPVEEAMEIPPFRPRAHALRRFEIADSDSYSPSRGIGLSPDSVQRPLLAIVGNELLGAFEDPVPALPEAPALVLVQPRLEKLVQLLLVERFESPDEAS